MLYKYIDTLYIKTKKQVPQWLSALRSFLSAIAPNSPNDIDIFVHTIQIKYNTNKIQNK